jgi:hypothetical protein
MRAIEARVAWGGLLIVLGVLFLLQTMGLVPGDLGLLWALVFGATGLAFLYLFLDNRERSWWAVIPGFTLLGLAGVILIGEFGTNAMQPLGGALFLGMIGLSFVAIYAQNREHWWAIIPAGTLLTLALIAGLSGAFEGEGLGSLLFFGVAATFLVLYTVPTSRGRMTWALIPAGVLAILGAVVMATSSPVAGYIWPLALIVVGLYLLLRSRGTRQA